MDALRFFNLGADKSELFAISMNLSSEAFMACHTWMEVEENFHENFLPGIRTEWVLRNAGARCSDCRRAHYSVPFHSSNGRLLYTILTVQKSPQYSLRKLRANLVFIIMWGHSIVSEALSTTLSSSVALHGIMSLGICG